MWVICQARKTLRCKELTPILGRHLVDVLTECAGEQFLRQAEKKVQKNGGKSRENQQKNN